MKYAVHFSYVGTAESTSVASVARRSWPESRSSGAARQSGHLSSRALSGSAEFSRTIGNVNATLLPALVGLSSARSRRSCPRWRSRLCEGRQRAEPCLRMRFMFLTLASIGRGPDRGRLPKELATVGPRAAVRSLFRSGTRAAYPPADGCGPCNHLWANGLLLSQGAVAFGAAADLGPLLAGEGRLKHGSPSRSLRIDL